jgi:hypothetical protein
MCDEIERRGMCEGRDTSLTDYRVDVAVHAGQRTTGQVLPRLTTRLDDEGAGRTLSNPLALGTYTVCEVQRRTGQTVETLAYEPRLAPSTALGDLSERSLIAASRCAS